MRRTYMQIPGPANVPDSVMDAMRRHPIDHRSPEFAELLAEIKANLKRVFCAPDYDIVMYPASGTGGMEAALVNTLSPGSKVLAFNQGIFSERFASIAKEFGCDVHQVDLEWGEAVTESLLYQELTSDYGKGIEAILLTHTETSTGVSNDLSMVRSLLDELSHPALLLVDAVSSLAITPLPVQELRLDVVISASQKGLMLPGGLAFVAFSPKAMEAGYTAMLPKGYWDARLMLARNSTGQMPYTPAITLMYGLQESLRLILDEEGLEQVWERHARNAEAVRKAMEAMHLELLPRDPHSYAHALTCARLPIGYEEEVIVDMLRAYGVSVGGGLARYRGKLLRVGHLGALHEAEVLAIVSLLELVFVQYGMPLRFGEAAAAALLCFAAKKKASL